MLQSSNISVFLASYNGEKFIEEQIDSILSQSSPPDELIVCDDCSCDNTITILDKYKRKGAIRYYINNTRKGLTANFIQAAQYTKSNNWLAFSDQDDIWLPDKLKTYANHINHIHTDKPYLLYSDAILINEKSEVINPSFWNELGLDGYHHSLKTLIIGNFILGCTAVINPSLKYHLPEIPVDVALHHDAWIALYAFSFGDFHEIETPLVYYRKHSKNASGISDFVKKQSFYDKIKQHVTAAFINDYVEDQIALLETFMLQYHLKVLSEIYLKNIGRKRSVSNSLDFYIIYRPAFCAFIAL